MDLQAKWGEEGEGAGRRGGGRGEKGGVHEKQEVGWGRVVHQEMAL